MLNIIKFIKGYEECFECGGTGQSPRGYGDTSPCGTCHETGILKVRRLYMIKDLILTFKRKCGRFFSLAK